MRTLHTPTFSMTIATMVMKIHSHMMVTSQTTQDPGQIWIQQHLLFIFLISFGKMTCTNTWPNRPIYLLHRKAKQLGNTKENEMKFVGILLAWGYTSCRPWSQHAIGKNQWILMDHDTVYRSKLPQNVYASETYQAWFQGLVLVQFQEWLYTCTTLASTLALMMLLWPLCQSCEVHIWTIVSPMASSLHAWFIFFNDIGQFVKECIHGWDSTSVIQRVASNS